MKDIILVLDCETCTLPLTRGADESAEAFGKRKKEFALANPLIYNIAWKLVDRQGVIHRERNYMVQETFFTPSVFNTAYYKEKRPFYIDLIQKQAIEVANWEVIATNLANDIAESTIVSAYNAGFDFVKAIPFTETYHRNLYSNNFDSWVEWKTKPFKRTKRASSTEVATHEMFSFRGAEAKLVDIWNMACDNIMNRRAYKKFCLEHDLHSHLYFKTSAEACHRYLINDPSFIESHTAMEDVNIEIDILLTCLKRSKPTYGLEHMPFQKVGTPAEIINEVKAYHVYKCNLVEKLEVAIDGATWQPYKSRLEKILATL